MSEEDANKPKKRGSLAAETQAKADELDAAFSVGDAVLVQAVDDKSTLLPATIVRKHMSGEFTVEFTDTGKTESTSSPAGFNRQRNKPDQPGKPRPCHCHQAMKKATSSCIAVKTRRRNGAKVSSRCPDETTVH
jgi:hypothetical protein